MNDLKETKGFPTLAVIVLVLSIIWLIQHFTKVAVPLVPIILVVISISWIVSFYRKK